VAVSTRRLEKPPRTAPHSPRSLCRHPLLFKQIEELSQQEVILALSTRLFPSAKTQFIVKTNRSPGYNQVNIRDRSQAVLNLHWQPPGSNSMSITRHTWPVSLMIEYAVTPPLDSLPKIFCPLPILAECTVILIMLKVNHLFHSTDY
jgi:hypothetical protein